MTQSCHVRPRRPHVPWAMRVRCLSRSRPGNGTPLRQAGPARARITARETRPPSLARPRWPDSDYPARVEPHDWISLPERDLDDLSSAHADRAGGQVRMSSSERDAVRREQIANHRLVLAATGIDLLQRPDGAVQQACAGDLDGVERSVGAERQIGDVREPGGVHRPTPPGTTRQMFASPASNGKPVNWLT